jgi:crotonobetainyl-CoA:carnitine CoA-transferase CaiB-like acyl-CoA transferase
MTAPRRTGPLVGMRVLDMSHVMAGPTCCLMLADMGADVIKIEKADGGDDSRRMTPPTINGEPASFMMMNRNKRGIVLDLKKPAAKKALLKLVGTADVLVENYRKGTMEKLGLGYDVLAKENPGLIYCEISGFGRTGPLADNGGFDLVAQAMTGLMSITGEGPGRAPVKVGAPLTDITGGLLACMGVLAAYSNRLKTGKGQRVDTSLFEAGIVHTYWQSAIAFATGEAPTPLGSAHPLSAPYQAFQTKDGWVCLGASNQRTWVMFTEAVNAPQLATDPRFKDNAARMANLPALVDAIAPHFARYTNAEVLALLEKAGVPAGPVLDINQMHKHPQTIARNMVPTLDHPVAGKVQSIGLPIKFSATPGGVQHAAPVFGQHTRDVLAEAGYTDKEIDALIAEGAAK